MDQRAAHSLQKHPTSPARAAASPKKVQVVYYLSYRGGLLEQPHLLEVSLSSSRGLRLRDVKTRLASMRGAMMSSSFSWSYKRSYKEGFVWQDLDSDNDLIFPTHNGSEYIMKGCRLEPSCTNVEQIPASSPNLPHSLRDNVPGISTQMQPAFKLAELSASRIAAQPKKGINRITTDEHANKINFGSPSNASFHGCDDNITFNLGVIEGLEHLHLAKAIDLHLHDYAESQASTSLNHSYKATEQNKENVQNLKLGLESSVFKFHLKAPIIGRQQYESPQFFVMKKVQGESETTSNPRPLNVGADVATQTGEDDEITEIVDEHGKGKALCLPDFYRTDKLPCPKSRDQSTFPTRRVSVELSREEISPPPCSTSSQSTTMSAHSASSTNNAVGSSLNAPPKLSLNQTSCLAEDQKLQALEIISSSRIQADKEALLDEEEALASKSALDSLCQGSETSCPSEELKNLRSGAVDSEHVRKNSQSALTSSKIKPHVVNICSNSGRFLHLVSCGRGLEVIKPSDMCIRRSSSMNGLRADACEEASSMRHSSLLNANVNEYSSLASSPPNVNAEKETGATVGSCLPIAAKDVSSKMLYDADNLVTASPQDSSKKLWHLKGWVHSHYKKKRSTKSKNIPTDSAGHEDAYACLDLFEKHVSNLTAEGRDAEHSSSQCRLIRVENADYSSSSHQRSSSYGSNPNPNPTNEFVASPWQRPQNGSQGLIASSSTSSIYAYDRWW